MTLLETLSSMSPTYIKMRKLFLVTLYAHVLVLIEKVKKKTQLHLLGVNLRKEIKGKTGKQEFHVNNCFDLQNKYNSG